MSSFPTFYIVRLMAARPFAASPTLPLGIINNSLESLSTLSNFFLYSNLPPPILCSCDAVYIVQRLCTQWYWDVDKSPSMALYAPIRSLK